jgi:hypothetical protein
MKRIYIILLIGLVAMMQSCYKPGKLQVENHLSQVKIQDVKWGDTYIAAELLPGESSSEVTIDQYDEKLPASNKVSFVMTANNKSIYLETKEEFPLEEDGMLVITIGDDTEVESPNQ